MEGRRWGVQGSSRSGTLSGGRARDLMPLPVLFLIPLGAPPAQGGGMGGWLWGPHRHHCALRTPTCHGCSQAGVPAPQAFRPLGPAGQPDPRDLKLPPGSGCIHSLWVVLRGRGTLALVSPRSPAPAPAPQTCPSRLLAWDLWAQLSSRGGGFPPGPSLLAPHCSLSLWS